MMKITQRRFLARVGEEIILLERDVSIDGDSFNQNRYHCSFVVRARGLFGSVSQDIELGQSVMPFRHDHIVELSSLTTGEAGEIQEFQTEREWPFPTSYNSDWPAAWLIFDPQDPLRFEVVHLIPNYEPTQPETAYSVDWLRGWYRTKVEDWPAGSLMFAIPSRHPSAIPEDAADLAGSYRSRSFAWLDIPLTYQRMTNPSGSIVVEDYSGALSIEARAAATAGNSRPEQNWSDTPSLPMSSAITTNADDNINDNLGAIIDSAFKRLAALPGRRSEADGLNVRFFQRYSDTTPIADISELGQVLGYPAVEFSEATLSVEAGTEVYGQ